MKSAFLAPPGTIDMVYDTDRRAQIAARTDLLSVVVAPSKLNEQIHLLHDTEVIFSGWGFPQLTAEQLDQMPRLRAVFYAAGSVQPFARPLLERGITLISAWRANAVPVAEYTLAQILLASKGYFRNIREYAGAEGARGAFRGAGNYGETVALLGMGAIGRTVAGLLKPFMVNVIVFDPFLNAAETQALGVQQVSLPEAFERAYVVSNHLPAKPETEGMLNGELFRGMRDNATFINTGRGKTVNHHDLIEVFGARPDLTALLDVTDPEPLPPDSPLFMMPNVYVTSHIAGSIGNEVHRLADYCIAEFDRYERGEALQHAVTLDMLNLLA